MTSHIMGFVEYYASALCNRRAINITIVVGVQLGVSEVADAHIKCASWLC